MLNFFFKFKIFRCLFIENFIPPDFVQRVKDNAIFDADEGKWFISRNATYNPLLQDKLHNDNTRLDSGYIKSHYQKPEMVDSGLESSSGSATGGENKSMVNSAVNGVNDFTIAQTSSKLSSINKSDYRDSNGFFDVNKKISGNELLLKRPVSF